MSVKFEKETVRETAIPGGRRHDLSHEMGQRFTGGKSQTGYLAAYLQQLQSNPLRTKMLTSGSLAALQEVLASWIAHDKSKHGHYISSRVPKMAVYGAFISAPLGHLLISILQRLFAGRTSLKAKILQILVSNLIVSPIQNTVYLTSMAVIAGARTFHQVRATVKAGFMPVMKVSWVTSPLALAFAQKFLPEQTWVPFFNIIAFVIGTYINAHTKKKRLDALRKKTGLLNKLADINALPMPAMLTLAGVGQRIHVNWKSWEKLERIIREIVAAIWASKQHQRANGSKQVMFPACEGP